MHIKHSQLELISSNAECKHDTHNAAAVFLTQTLPGRYSVSFLDFLFFLFLFISSLSFSFFHSLLKTINDQLLVFRWNP